jgi:hypothetical protein
MIAADNTPVAGPEISLEGQPSVWLQTGGQP